MTLYERVNDILKKSGLGVGEIEKGYSKIVVVPPQNGKRGYSYVRNYDGIEGIKQNKSKKVEESLITKDVKVLQQFIISYRNKMSKAEQNEIDFTIRNGNWTKVKTIKGKVVKVDSGKWHDMESEALHWEIKNASILADRDFNVYLPKEIHDKQCYKNVDAIVNGVKIEFRYINSQNPKTLQGKYREKLRQNPHVSIYFDKKADENPDGYLRRLNGTESRNPKGILICYFENTKEFRVFDYGMEIKKAVLSTASDRPEISPPTPASIPRNPAAVNKSIQFDFVNITPSESNLQQGSTGGRMTLYERVNDILKKSGLGVDTSDIEKSHKYIRRWRKGDDWRYEMPKDQKKNVKHSEAKLEIAKKTKLITGIRPLLNASESEIDNALVDLSLYAMDGKLKCPALGNNSIYITGRTQEHIKETHGEQRSPKETQHKAKYIPFVSEILKNGRISEKSMSKEGVIYGIIGQVEYFDDEKNKTVRESVELAINFDASRRKYVFSFSDKAIKKSLLESKDFHDHFSAGQIVDTKTVPITINTIPQKPLSVNKSIQFVSLTHNKVVTWAGDRGRRSRGSPGRGHKKWFLILRRQPSGAYPCAPGGFFIQGET